MKRDFGQRKKTNNALTSSKMFYQYQLKIELPILLYYALHFFFDLIFFFVMLTIK